MVEWQRDPVDIVGIGDALADLSTRASQLPPRGGNIWSTAVSMSPGGTTANVAANVARLGMRSAFVGCVGDDPYGQYLIREFHEAGVDTRGLVVRPGSFTGIVLAIIDDEGERTFIACAKGASHTTLVPEDLTTIDFGFIRALHASGVCLVEEPSRTAVLGTLERAHEAGCTVFYDPNLRLEGDDFPAELRTAQMKAISLADVLLIGDEEIELLLGIGSTQTGARMLIDEGAKVVVAKQGGRGATAYSNEAECSLPAFRVPVVSTAGAGDAFDAGFIAAWHQGADVRRATEYACAAAAIKVTRQSARSTATHAEVLAFLEAHGNMT